MVVADSEVDFPVDLEVVMGEVSLVASPEASVAAMATPTAVQISWCVSLLFNTIYDLVFN